MAFVRRIAGTAQSLFRPTFTTFTTSFLLALAVLSPLRAEEPFRAFLDGLRGRGYHDVALEYLQSLETSPLATAEVRELIPYERAVTLVEFSRTKRDLDERFALLDQAQQRLEQFVKSQSSHPKAFAARSQLGNLIVERARIKVEQSKSGDTETLLKQARQQYERGFEELSKLEAAVSAELDQIPKVLDLRDRKQAALAQRRKQLRADNLQTELLAAAIREEMADTVPEGSEAHQKDLAEAAGLYDKIYKKYRSRLAGLYARMFQGRCNQRLGKTKDALGYYGELLDQPDEPEEMQKLKTETLRLAMECWLAPNERKYLEAIKQATEWMAIVPRSFQRDPNMLAIRFSLARAYKMQADDYERLKVNDPKLIPVALESARKHAAFVAGEPGELQEEAAQMLVSLGGRALRDQDDTPQNFAQAAEEGKKSLDEIGPATQKVLAIQQQIRAAGPTGKAGLQQQLTEAQDQLAESQAAAMQSYRLALELADASTPPSELNLARYFLCYLYYLDGKYHEAALVGDFVARRHPQSDAALQCAKIALQCYMTMLATSAVEDVGFEIERLMESGLYIADTWPDTADAVESLTKLVPIMVNAGAVDHAKALTDRIPKGAAQRWQAELTTGQAMWAQHVRAQSERTRSQSADEPPPDSEASTTDADQLAAGALQMLTSGYENLPEAPTVNAFNATAMLSLAQASIAATQPEKAVEVLEHATLGPLTLITEQHPAAANPILVRQSYQAALQAYVGSMRSAPDMMVKAKAAMASLQQSVGSDAAGKQQMLAIYVNLAQSVEAQMKSAPPDEKQQLSQVFEAFLQELSAGSSDVGVLNWVAETFASLGSGFDDDPSVLNPEAAKYYQRSIAAFTNLLSVSSLQPQLATQVRARLASVKARSHDFAGALEDFRAILQTSPNAVNVQVEAARLLARWAAVDPTKYDQAIAGVGEGKQRTVWGWGKIASATMPHQQFRDTFYEARYEISKCQLGQAKTVQGAKRNSLLASAQRNLKMTKTLYPTLGGEKWTQQYDQLLKQIEAEQAK